MGHFDEVCLLCGVSPIPPSELSPYPEGTANDLARSLLEDFPGILGDIDGDIDSEDDLQALLLEIIEELEPADLQFCGGAFHTCIAVGYFDDDGNVPHEDVDDPVIKRKIPDGRFVTTRLVTDPHCGEFCREVVKKTNDIGVVVSEEQRMSEISEKRCNAAGVATAAKTQ